ncbi:MAG: hypothetical protein RL637_842 [Pseudomonadota bacterium]
MNLYTQLKNAHSEEDVKDIGSIWISRSSDKLN